MVSTRGGAILKGSNSNSNKNAVEPPSTKSQQMPNISKKRKAENEAPEEENKENIERPSTPPAQSKSSTTPPNDSELAHLPSYERTPGRVGPIKEVKFNVSPDIKPFKGPPGKKVRKTAWEKNEEYKQFARENEDHVFHE